MEVTSAAMGATETEVERDAEDEASPEIDFATYVAIETILSAGGGPLTLLLADRGVASHGDYAAARAQFDRERAQSPTLDGAFQRMGEYFLEEYRSEREREQRASEERAAERRAMERAREAARRVEIVEPAPEPLAATPAPEPPRRDLRGTAFSFEAPRGAELPFVAAPAAPPAPPPPPAARPAGQPAPRASLSGTALAHDPLPIPALPFPAANSAAAPLPKKNRPSTSVGASRGVGAGPLPIPAGVKLFSDDAPAAPLPPSPPAAPAPPRLTLEQHASLCAELGRAPEREAEILHRYGVAPAERRALDDHYRAVVAASPPLRAAWNSAFQTYAAWLATPR